MIKHDGGPCPVVESARVRVYYRDGISNDNQRASFWTGDCDWWKHESENRGNDIIGYDLIDAPAALGEDVLREILADENRKLGRDFKAELILSERLVEDAAIAGMREIERRTRHAHMPDKARLDWLNEQIVDVIYLDDGRLIDVKGNDVRKAIDAAMSEAVRRSREKG